MKTIFTRLLLFGSLLYGSVLFAQQADCKYSVEDKTPGQELRTTQEYLMHEYAFGGSSEFLFFSLSNSQDVPILNFQLLGKSKDFSKMFCFDKDSRVYIQLANNKIVTLIYAGEDQCSIMIYDDKEQVNIRTLSAPFLFIKGSFEDLESAPISFIRVKYSGEIKDYPINTELKSETMKQTYKPDRYFIENLKCIK